MRIISSYKDYYDTASGFGVDLKKTFHRNLVNTDIAVDLTKTESKFAGSMNLYNLGDCHKNDISVPMVTVEMSTLFFCGKLYPIAKIEYPFDFDGGVFGTMIFYNVADLYNFFNKEHPVYYKTKLSASNSIRRKYLEDHFSQAKTNSYLDNLSHQLSAPYFLIEAQEQNFLEPFGRKKTSKNKKFSIEINTPLKSLAFYKELDAYTCFQEVEQYVFGVLSNNDPIPDIPDKYKISGKGFDEKYGFRTRPKK